VTLPAAASPRPRKPSFFAEDALFEGMKEVSKPLWHRSAVELPLEALLPAVVFDVLGMV